MALFYKVNNTWKKCDIHYKNSSGWKEVKNIFHKVGTTWKPIWNYFWEIGAWGACSAPCGGGTQNRTVQCKRSDGFYKSDAFCLDHYSKPITEQECNTQNCNAVVPIDNLMYKAFATHAGGTVPVARAYAVNYYVTTNWSWPWPIVINNPFEALTFPITVQFFARFNANFGNRSVSGALYVDVDEGRVLSAGTGTAVSCCAYMNRTITLQNKPTFIKLYYYITTSKSNQGMSVEFGWTSAYPMMLATDANGHTLKYY